MNLPPPVADRIIDAIAARRIEPGQRLTEAELARIDEAFPNGATAGDRYADMSTIDA